MPATLPIPAALSHGPFTHRDALRCEVSEKVLRGRRFRRLHPRVWVPASYTMSDLDWIRAAELAMPAEARASHLTRLRRLGLEYGQIHPLHFTIQGELHIALHGTKLHRTKVMPPTDAQGVTPAAAFIGYAADARVIDLIKVGDWLLHREHMSLDELLETARRDRWRPGSGAAIWVARFLDARSRSLKESETRALLVFAGLPEPEVNADLFNAAMFIACVDLLYREWRVIVEYEGRQHAEDIWQWNKDITRYAGLRDDKWAYIQVTQEMLKQPRAVVLRVHGKLVEGGYRGPAPLFADRWRTLFYRVPSSLTRPAVT